MKERRRDGASMKRFYDWFCRYYGFIETNVGRTIDKALHLLDPHGNRFAGDTVLEWACGSGELAFRLIPRVLSYQGRDLSAGMLERARKRWALHDGPEKARYVLPPFSEGDMTAETTDAGKDDWVFMSFSLHLFDLASQKKILGRSLERADKGVIVIDHAQRWQPVVALAEWFEGSHYDTYITHDYRKIADELHCGFRLYETDGYTAMEFLKAGGTDK